MNLRTYQTPLLLQHLLSLTRLLVKLAVYNFYLCSVSCTDLTIIHN